MSKSDKTEKATPQRRAKAREEGQVARSAEVSVFVGMALGVLTLRVFIPSGAAGFANEVRLWFTNLEPRAVEDIGAGGLGRAAASLLLPFLGTAVFGALLAGFAQTRFNISLKAAKPKFSKLSPKQNIKKFAPSSVGWELARTLTKLGLLVVVAWEPMVRMKDRISGGRGIDAAIGVLVGEAWTVLIRAIVLAFVIGAADYAWNKRKHERDLRMEKHEVKQEHKNTEGDPLLKGERRRRAAELSRNRMLADVGQADVVLVNPTDLAIALRYDPAQPAPLVLAKGADHLAARIRAEARRNGVPIHADIPLCRALYRQVKVGSFIPQAMFDAIAVVLVWAYRRTGRRPGAATPAPTPVLAAGGAR